MKYIALSLAGLLALCAMPNSAQAGGRGGWGISVGFGSSGDRSWNNVQFRYNSGWNGHRDYGRYNNGWYGGRWNAPRYNNWCGTPGYSYSSVRIYSAPPVIYAPPPVVYVVPPVVYAPPPVIYSAPPVVYSAPPTYYAPQYYPSGTYTSAYYGR